MFDITPPTFIIDFADLFCDRYLADFMAYYCKHYPRSNDTTKMKMDYLTCFKGMVTGTG